MSDATIDQRGKYVALFGYYKYGNYGDDLMAVIFGRELQARQIPFQVYHLRDDVLAEFDFDGTTSIDELLAGASAVVYGGGGAFLTSKDGNFESDLKRLCDLCTKANIPIYMFSVGGDGKPVENIAATRRELLKQASFVTFRNQEDAPLLDSIGRANGAIHHDVVWQTSKCFPLLKPDNSKVTIGIDNSLLGRRRGRWIVYCLMFVCRALRKPYRFVNIMQSRAENARGNFSGSIRYDDGMQQFIREIVETDLIITNRLHLGLTAMSYDIPAVQLFPQPKAILLFNRLGLGRLLCSFNFSLVRLVWLLLSIHRIRKLKPSELVDDFEGVVQDSKSHLYEMTRVLETKCATGAAT